MGKKRFLLLISIPALVILIFLGINVYIVNVGQEILLKAVPVDPRDLFRGDYVNLRYEISRIELNTLPRDADFSRGHTVYAALSKKEKFWTIDSVSHEKPDINKNQVCMKGRVTGSSSRIISVEWGIESYFVPEGKGRQIERQINAENVSVIVSVGFNGSSVVKKLLINDEPVTFE